MRCKILQFLSQDGHLSGGDEDELVSPFLSNFFNFLLDFHDSHSKAVRFRVCQLISKLFDGLNNETSIEESLADRLFDCMLKRLTDKFPAIRVQAVKAIYRLQDSQDPQCPVIESFIHLMERDSSAEVRRAALNSIAVAHWTLGSIISEFSVIPLMSAPNSFIHSSILAYICYREYDREEGVSYNYQNMGSV